MSSRSLALRYSAATFAASLVWTVVLVLLARQGRTGEVGLLLTAELVGGVAAPLLTRWLPSSRRLLVAAIGYTAVRALLVPALTTGMLVPALLCLVAGMFWRLLSGVVVATAAGRSPDTLAKAQAWSTAAATAGTAASPLLVAAPWLVLTAVAGTILLVVPIPTPLAPPRTADRRQRQWHLPPALTTAAVVTVAGATTAFPRLLPAVTELSAGTVWVAPAAVVAFAVTFTAPRLLRLLPVEGLPRASLLAAGAASAWLIAGMHPLALLGAVAVGNALRQVADVHVDTLCAVGADPARTLINVQVLQALAGALTAAAVSTVLGTWPLWQIAGLLLVPLAAITILALLRDKDSNHDGDSTDALAGQHPVVAG